MPATLLRVRLPTRAPGQQPIDEPWLRGYPPIEPETPGFEPADACAARRRPGRDQEPRARDCSAAVVPLLRRHGQGRAARAGVRVGEGDRAPGIGFLFMPKSVGGADDLAGFMAAFETLGFPRHFAGHQVRRAVRPVGRQRAAARHRLPSPEISARHRDGRTARLLRHDRDRPRLQRARHRDDRHVRPGRRASSTCTRRRSPPARTTSATRASTGKIATVFAQLCKRAANARRPRVRRAHPRRRGTRCPACAGGQRRETRAQRRGQRPGLVRPRPRAARGDAGPFRAGRGGWHLHLEHQEPGGAVFHDAGHAGWRDGSASATAG